MITDAAGAKLRARFGLADSLLEELRAGELDIVVSAIPPRLPGITGKPLFDEEFLLVAAPSWQSPPTDPAEVDVALAHIPVIAYADNLPILRRYWRTVFGRRPVDVAPTAIIPDLRGIRAALVGGAGMSVLPQYLIEDQLSSGALVVLHQPALSPLNTVYLATRTGEVERSRPLREFARALERLVEARPGV